MYILYLGRKVQHMKTRKIVLKIKEKNRRYLKIHKGGQSSDSNKSSDSVRRVAAASPRRVASASPRRVASSSPRRVASASPRRVAAAAASPKTLKSPKLRSHFSRHRTHSQGDSTPKIIDEDIMNKLRKISSKPASMTSPEKRNLKRFRRRLQENIPQAPPVILTPQGRNIMTTYTPTMDIVDDGTRIPVMGKPTLTTASLHMIPFDYIYDHSLPLSFLSKSQANLKPEEKRLYMNISMFPGTYAHLSYMIYDILKRINKKDSFANVLVKGKLRDELLPCITVTSIETMQSRLFMSREETEQFMHVVSFYNDQFSLLGSNPTHREALDIFGIHDNTPDAVQPEPNSYRVVGYKTHPMFRTQPMTRVEEQNLVTLSEQHKEIKGEDFAYVYAHGALANELSPDMKFLANKYLRIIELGKVGQALSIPYNSFMVKLNDIMRNPRYYAMFDNTDEGELTRKVAFRFLCPYFTIDSINGCASSDTFKLIDITHERVFSGHLEDMMIKEDRKVTYKSLKNMTTMGIFLPVNYNTDNSTKYVAKKELYKLYPGTTYFSKNTEMRLIETLVPMAIQQNRRINMIVSSCVVTITEGDDIYNMSKKPGDKNVAIELLTSAKRFLSKLNKLMNDYVTIFYDHGIKTFHHTVANGKDSFVGYRDYVKDRNHEEIFKIGGNINNFYIDNFLEFKRHNYTATSMVYETFSFAGLHQGTISNRLIQNNVALRREWYYPYVNELIKVKIFLMTEFKDVFFTRVTLIKTSLEIINENLIELRQLYGPAPLSDLKFEATCNMLDSAIRKSTDMLEYFNELLNVLDYIYNGFLYDANTDPESFANHKKYIEMKKEYDETFAKRFYIELTENLDYDRYEGENVGFSERVYKAEHVNPLPRDKFRKTGRHMYRFKVLPNYDEILKRRKTMKKQLYEKLGIGKHAQRAKRSSGVSI